MTGLGLSYELDARDCTGTPSERLLCTHCRAGAFSGLRPTSANQPRNRPPIRPPLRLPSSRDRVNLDRDTLRP